jgi:hypothetical protein
MTLGVLPIEKPFFELLKQAEEADAHFKAAAGKVKKKVFESFASKMRLKDDELLLLHVCSEKGEIQPGLSTFIDQFPRLPRQTAERHAQYQWEIKSAVERVVFAVAVLAADGKLPIQQGDNEGKVPILDSHEHPLLAEIYGLLPRAWVSESGVKSGRRAEHLSPNGMLFYASCAEAIRRCAPSTLHELMVEQRNVLNKALQDIYPLHKYCMSYKFISIVRRAIGVEVNQPQPLPNISSWPQKIQSQWAQFEAAARGNIPAEILKQAVSAKVSFKPKLSRNQVTNTRYAISRILSQHPQGDKFGLEQLLAFEKRRIKKDGKQQTVQFNQFLSPWREADMDREDEYKRAGFDSATFHNALKSLLTFARYLGLFKCVSEAKKAFKIKLDRDTTKNRKARKKQLIDRRVLAEWLEKKWPEFERILLNHTFERQDYNKVLKTDKERRPHNESDRNMRFVLFYLKFLTMLIMGYRQQLERDCLYGDNLVVTRNSIKWHFRRNQVKNDKELNFTANLAACELTHGLLIKAHYIFHKEAFAYIQDRLDFWPTGDPVEDRLMNPTGQVFVNIKKNGKFGRFHPIKGATQFAAQFKRDCFKFLADSGLSKEAIRALHAHYCRGASMDIFIVDQGGSEQAAELYYGDSIKTIREDYTDQNAALDASHQVVLMNAQMKQVDQLNKGTSGEDPEVKSLREELKASRRREAEQKEEIASLRSQMAQMTMALNTRFDEVINAVKGKAAA